MYILTITVIAVIGAFAVAKGKAFIANLLWLISNPLMAHYNYQLGEMELAGMFTVYFLIALYGVWTLKVKGMLKVK
jgi:hypothetical protein